MHVLIVEDNPDLRDSVARFLEASGHSVTAAATGEEAFDLAIRAPPNVALLDIGLPGIDGRELLRRLKRTPKTRHVRVALLSAQICPEDYVKQPLGADAILKKPFSPDRLLHTLSRLAGDAKQPLRSPEGSDSGQNLP